MRKVAITLKIVQIEEKFFRIIFLGKREGSLETWPYYVFRAGQLLYTIFCLKIARWKKKLKRLFQLISEVPYHILVNIELFFDLCW